ncbi:MAG: hypothetical protein KME21_13310 [Desmonostoc vinosum HA7617-LM4]|jgi:hypothetical protein|nr:hypothetical protein [Desmonostoc vinosum HA7617-LM4]
MLRVYHILLGAILLILIPLGAKFVLPYFSQPKVEKNPTGATRPNSNQENIWQKILGNTDVPTGWQAVPCKGNAPLLCVTSNKELLGTVEIEIYPLANNQDFQKKLTSTGISPGSQVDFQNSKYQTQVIKALKAWVADYYTSLAKDRQSKYGTQIVLTTFPQQTVTIGKLPGIRYGFAGLKRQGGIQEQYIGHVTFDGTALYVITTAFNSSSATGKFEKLENLAVFQPYLNAIAADLRLAK